MGKELKIVKLLEPELCLRCRFAEVAEVDTSTGATERMIHCRRGDCDNWDIQNSETAKAIRVLPE
ncbi:MAG TPA: hypothetical protein VG944_10500 [Fimbriimonas sp.]|nr:hypothetical protein [Fimbriimonas sp.]